MKMLTNVVSFTFAYCSMLRVLLPSLRRHPSVVRVRVVLRSLRLGGLPTADAWVMIADTATPRDRNDPAAIDNGDVLQDLERHSTLQRGQADRRRDRRRHRRRKRGCIGRQPDPSVMAGRSRSKNGVAPLARSRYVAPYTCFLGSDATISALCRPAAG